MEPIKVLFVCLGNICRSPMAEGIFQHLVTEAGLDSKFEIDSCGTSAFHAGELADSRMRKTAASKGIALVTRSRQLVKNDFSRFDYILPMDKSNFRDVTLLQEANPKNKAKVVMMRDFDDSPDDGNVPDPYWSGEDGFGLVFDILDRSNRKFLDFLKQEHGL